LAIRSLHLQNGTEALAKGGTAAGAAGATHAAGGEAAPPAICHH